MVMSMTGYGRSIMHIDDSDITVEIRSVNNRFADISVKMPRSLSYCEDKVKTELLKRVNRGKIDVFISYQKPQGEQVEIEPNISAARGYYDALKKIDAELGTHTEINANMLARFSDVFVVTREVPDEEKVWSDIRQVLTAAADNFNAMRAAEGEKMAEDVLGKIANVEELVLKVEAASEPRVEAYRNKLYNRLLDVLSNSDIDEKRILEEAAIYADRKRELNQRVQTMIGYLTTQMCRSRYLLNYFGEEHAADCGLCDNCTEESAVPACDDQQIRQRILDFVAEHHPSSLLDIHLPDLPQQEVGRVLHQMLEEEELRLT